MIKLKTLLQEQSNTNTFQMYHGGKRWSRIPQEIIGSSKGRYEAGAGIYFTNDYNTARKYAKGSRVVHLVNIDKNYKDIQNITVPLEDIINFVKNTPGLKRKPEIIQSLQNNASRMQRDSISLDILNNLIVNYEAGAGKAGIAVANYFTSKGADAKLEQQSGDEVWLIVFNPNIIKSVSVVNPKSVTSNFPFTLPNPKNIQENINTQNIKPGDTLRHKDFGYLVNVIQLVKNGLVVKQPSSHQGIIYWETLKNWTLV